MEEKVFYLEVNGTGTKSELIYSLQALVARLEKAEEYDLTDVVWDEDPNTTTQISVLQ